MFCNASALHGVGPPVLSSEGTGLHTSAHLQHSMAIPMSLEQAIARLGLCMFDFGGMWNSSFGRFHAPSAFDFLDA